MRLWSLDPSYLDLKGLGGVWREGLLAQAVLLGKTKGWKDHSHLLRFKTHEKPVAAIGFYLLKIYEEATSRGYRYNQSRIVKPDEKVSPLTVTQGQLLYEFHILKERVKIRAPHMYEEVLKKRERREKYPQPHPLFCVVDGEVERWEKSYWRWKQEHRILFPQ